jgi:HEAT repeat protein
VIAKFGDKMAVAQGSGTLIDKTNRLVLTNNHVVSGSEAIAVFFQAFDNGRRIGEINFFMEQLKKSKDKVIEGKVVHTDKHVDLALVQLNRLPPDAQALPIADKSPAVTNAVLSVGHPKGIGGGGLWVHTSGEIRQFQRKRWRAGNQQQFVDHEADVILTNSQTNPGDSGGPLVNMRAQLVGVTQGGVRDANALSIFIDLSEVRQMLKDYEARSSVKLALETQSGVGGDKSSLPKLLDDLGSKDPQVRTRAALALGELGPDAQRAISALFKVLKDRDENLARDAAQALRAIGAPSRDDLPLLIAGLRDNSPRVRGYAVEALGKMGPEARSAVPNLVQVLKEKETEPELRQQAARCLGQIGAAATTEGVPALSEALKDSEVVVRETAAEALGKFGGQARTAAPSLIAVLADKETTVRRAALAALAQIGPDGKEVLPKLKPSFKDADPEVRRHALDVLGRLGAEAVKDKEALEALKAALDDMNLCKNALDALARIGPPAKELAKGLTRHLQNEKHRLAAVAALGSLLEKVKPVPVEAKVLRPVLDELINLFEVRDHDLHTKVIEALGKIGSAAVTPLYQALQKAARNDLPYTRYGVVEALGAIGRDARRKEVITTLSQLSKVDPSPQIRDACDQALQRIQ